MDAAEPPRARAATSTTTTTTTTDTSKNPSSISSFLRFSKICKLGSAVAASSPQKPTTELPPAAANEEADSSDRKIHPRPFDDERSNLADDPDRVLMGRVFAGVSALKLAYIELQQAHVPYHPDKIQAADALVISELRSLSDLHAEVRSRSPLSLEIQDQQELLEELQSKLQSLDSDVLQLRRELEGLDQKHTELEQEEQAKARHLVSFVINQELTPISFAGVVKLAFGSIHEFTKPLIGLMKASNWDLDVAANAIDSSVVYADRSHKKYAFEAFLSKAMLTVSNTDRFGMEQFDQVVSSRDPFEALLQYPDSDFGRFCRSKYVSAVHPKMEGSFFGNCDQRAFVLRGGHPRTPFYQAFVKMSRWVWAMQVLAHSFIPKAEAFCVEKGRLYSEESMESVVKMAAPAPAGERLVVGLNVMPGFKIGRDVVRCRVYLCRTKSSG